MPHTDALVDGSRPHIKGCIMHLEVLGAILGLVPRQITLQFSKEPKVGRESAQTLGRQGGRGRAATRMDTHPTGPGRVQARGRGVGNGHGCGEGWGG